MKSLTEQDITDLLEHLRTRRNEASAKAGKAADEFWEAHHGAKCDAYDEIREHIVSKILKRASNPPSRATSN